MIDLGPHAVFIAGAYLGVTLVVALLIIWTMTDAHLQRKRLAELEARGIRRRSDNVAARTTDNPN